MMALDPAVFDAVAEPTRRILLDRMRGSGPQSIAALGAGLPMSRQAVTKHLDVLAGAGLVRTRRVGRQRLHELDPAPLRAVDDWLRPYAAFWDERIEALRRHLGEPAHPDDSEASGPATATGWEAPR